MTSHKILATLSQLILIFYLTFFFSGCFGSSKSASAQTTAEQEADEAIKNGTTKEKLEQHYLALRVDKMPFSLSSACEYQSKTVSKNIKGLNFVGEIKDGVTVKFAIGGRDVLEENVRDLFQRYEELGGESVREEQALSEWSGTVNQVRSQVKTTSARFQRDGDCIYRLTFVITAE